MNEMHLLERLNEDVSADPVALQRARTRLMRRASGPVRGRHSNVRRAVVGAAIVVAIATALVTVTFARSGPGAEAAASQVLDRAARQAADTEVRKDEWLYVRDNTVRWQEGDVTWTGTSETWVPGDPAAEIRLRDVDHVVYLREPDLPEIASDPAASVDDIYSWLDRESGDLRGADAAFERAAGTLADVSIPAWFKTRLFEAIKRIDGVRVVSESTDFAGREAIILGRAEGGGIETQLAFDPTDGAFIGYQGFIGEGELNYRTLLTTRVVSFLPKRATTCVALGDQSGYYAPPTCAADE